MILRYLVEISVPVTLGAHGSKFLPHCTEIGLPERKELKHPDCLAYLFTLNSAYSPIGPGKAGQQVFHRVFHHVYSWSEWCVVPMYLGDAFGIQNPLFLQTERIETW